MRPRKAGQQGTIHRIVQSLTSDPTGDGTAPKATARDDKSPSGRARNRSSPLRDQWPLEELSRLFSEQPRVAKHVFSRILREEGIEVTAQYIEIFGEGIVLDLAKDPNLQTDLAELAEFYAKTQIDLNNEDKLELLKALHNRAIGGKIVRSPIALLGALSFSGRDGCTPDSRVNPQWSLTVERQLS